MTTTGTEDMVETGCGRCASTGHYGGNIAGGVCFRCQGTGRVEVKASTLRRQAAAERNRQAREGKRLADLDATREARWAAFADAEPAIAAHILDTLEAEAAQGADVNPFSALCTPTARVAGYIRNGEVADRAVVLDLLAP